MLIKTPKEEIIEAIRQNYGFTPEMCELTAWGYNSVLFYIEYGSKRMMARVGVMSEKSLKRVQKDIILCKYLKPVFTTPTFISNLNDQKFTPIGDKILRLSEYLVGVSPFEMNWEILENAVRILRKLHQVSVPNNNNLDYFSQIYPEYVGATKYEGVQDVLLHGDFSPSNILVCDNKVCAVLDFELAMVGPREWDLATLVVFFWYRFSPSQKLDQVYKKVLQNYLSDTPTPIFFDEAFLKTLMVRQAKDFLDGIALHKDEYENKDYWKDRFDFAKNGFDQLVEFCK